MIRMRHLATALVIALIGSLLTVGAMSAHAEEEHATNTMLGWSDFGLMGVVLAVSALYWLLNRGERGSVGRDDADRSVSLVVPGSSERLVSSAAANRDGELAGSPLIAARRGNERRGG